VREILVVRWCWAHDPAVTGDADGTVGPRPESYSPGPNEFDAETNRRVCAMLAGRPVE
jgi:hypothetical protein